MIKQFLQQVPGELDALENEFIRRDYNAMAQIAHNMKTSVSFLGLTEKMGDTLDYIENNAGIQKENTFLKEKIKALSDICRKAFAEAEKYLNHLN